MTTSEDAVRELSTLLADAVGARRDRQATPTTPTRTARDMSAGERTGELPLSRGA
ncbi:MULTISPECIES: hypothetical protein [Sorangium]|uniref:Uncharacterized protein n=1 Tax=Sorangium cellulosum TaxID=56 RepID=A0A4P2R355_SORCE|nr:MULTISPECIES: hypothetical protein [Sorangium]AUX37450.1 uncharacterized protein SOCE836_096740 [Sorangium cellulosum]WCQ96739.1 hypothetical protein NQZ70_09526 [Sorangium sp. Soce836]